MTQIIHYAEITWPEVASFPRDIPFVLPLGDHIDLKRSMTKLGNPQQAVILPAMPFGWAGSGLEITPPTFGRCLQNLMDGLSEEGFTNLRVVAPPNTALGLPEGAYLNAPLLKRTSRESDFPTPADTGKVVLAPIGHTEQHGFHLPMSTDTIIIEAIGRETARLAPHAAVCLPAMPYGVSTHRQAFAGTFNMGGRAFEDFWLEVIDTLVARGFDRFYLLSGHGGNCSFLTNVIKYAGERHRRVFAATAWLYLSGPAGVAALQTHRSSAIGGMGHAGELETSLVLHLKPELVHIDCAVDETDFISTPDYYMDWVEGGALAANPPWDDDTATGAYGAGSLGTAEKGKIWLQAAVDEKVDHVQQIHEQHTRREARRSAGYGLWGRSQSSR
jgi:creatinine amidohydrolase